MAASVGPSTPPRPTSEQGTLSLTAEQQRNIELNRLRGEYRSVRNPFEYLIVGSEGQAERERARASYIINKCESEEASRRHPRYVNFSNTTWETRNFKARSTPRDVL